METLEQLIAEREARRTKDDAIDLLAADYEALKAVQAIPAETVMRLDCVRDLPDGTTFKATLTLADGKTMQFLSKTPTAGVLLAYIVSNSLGIVQQTLDVRAAELA